MKKNALRKDFYMEIYKSMGRFMSIFFIVMLGVAFFSGIRATEPDMRYTVDAYSDQYNLMDVQVISTLGLTEEDVKAIEEVEGISRAEGGYSSDVLCENHDSQQVLHVMSMLPTMNQAIVSEGRLPEAADECLVDEDFLTESDYEIGDQITFYSGTDDAVTDTFVTDTFTIVGSGNSPCYISFYRGSSTIGNGSVSGFVYVPEESFCLDVYTEIYAQADGAKELTVFTEEYDDRIEAVMDRVEEIREEREDARYEEIVGDANEELEKARAELADAKAEADAELSDAQAELDDGWQQLEDGRADANSGLQALQSGKDELTSQQSTLDQKRAELDAARAELDVAQEELDARYAELESGRQQLESGRAELESGQAQLDEKWAEWTAGNDAVTAGITALQAQLDEQRAAYDSLVASGSADPDVLAQLEAAIQAMEAQMSELESQKAALDAGYAELEANQAVLTENARALESAQAELDAGYAALESGQAELDANRGLIEDGEVQIEDGQKQINEAWNEIETNESELNAAFAEIAANEQTLIDAQAEFDEAKAEADQKIADGEQEIQDAADEISKIEHAKWYINSRDVLTEYSGYGDNADRIRAIGQVFPVLFFLVAALISLTTMTRMVEEQRVQIGTLKALGYPRRMIAAKYLGYAFAATVAGSVLGVLIGEKLLPYIIIVAYGIMYPHVDTIQLPYQSFYAALATIITLFCTVGAAWFACARELRESTAQLMRPPAPKSGKRVFLERVSFIWKRLNFIWKATIRNLFRYKKRFFMTISGISGCMALLMVGFGLEDSISNIARLQYGELQRYDASLILDTSADQPAQEEAIKMLEDDSRVESSQRLLMENTTIYYGKEQLEVYLTVPEDEEQYHDFVTWRDRVTHEEYELDDDGVILTEKAASLLGVEPGDSIVIRDDIQGEIELPVVHICENYMSHYVYMTRDMYEEVLKRAPEYNAVSFRMNEEDIDQLEDVGEQVLTSEGALSISYLTEVQGQVDTMLTSLDSVLGVIILFAGMLAFVVLYNLNNINITERRRELATLKVLGFYDGEVSAYVYRENILLTLIGSAVGCVLGWILHQFVITTVEIDTVMFGRNIDPGSFVISILITFGFSLFVNWVMYYKLKKIDMVESLKSVE